MEAAVLCGMDRQTLRHWVHCYNFLGLAGLSSRIPAGPKALAHVPVSVLSIPAIMPKDTSIKAEFEVAWSVRPV